MPIDQPELNPALPTATPERLPTLESGYPDNENINLPEKPQSEKGGRQELADRERISRPALQPIAGVSAPAAAPVSGESLIKYKQIEKVLEEDLGEIYNNLTPQEQKIFKIKGEETARSIFQLVYHQTKIKVKKIVKLIRGWLKAVPGVNKFFLEQEAKIKADKIVELADAGRNKKVEF